MTERDLTESLPELLRRLRHEAGLSQAKAEDRAGISHSVLSGLENGRRGLGDKNARRLASAYGVPPEVLLAHVAQREGLAPVDRERLAAAVELLAEVAPRFAVAVGRLEELLDGRSASRDAGRRQRGE